MNKTKLQKLKNTAIATLISFSLFLVPVVLPMIANVPVAQAVDGVPPVNLNAQPDANTGKGGFRLVICDGPAALNTWKTHQVRDPNDGAGEPSLGIPPGWMREPGWQPLPANEFIPCNFQGLMKQAQFLINAMIVLGVFAAMIGFAFAGYLYITGTQENLKRAHGIFPKVFWGFIIMITAWFMVSQLLKWLTGNSNYLNGTVS